MQITIPDNSVNIFREALAAMNQSGIPYFIGGAFAMFHYTSIWRDTNDLDFYINREDLQLSIDALSKSGFADYGEQAAGDREWIHHSTKNGVLIDLIWQPPNHLPGLSNADLERGPYGEFLGMPARFIPADILVWTKIFTMNRHRCDWPDVFNVVRACPDGLNWNTVMEKMGEHWPVLLSFLILFDWVYPGEAGCIPDNIRTELLRRKEALPTNINTPTRETVLDPWIYTRPISP